MQTLNLVQDACFVFAGLVGLGYFYFWLQGYGPSTAISGSCPDAGGAALEDDLSSGDTVGSQPDEPGFNIDGTPMLGFFDFNGNPYGFTRPITTPPCFADSDWDMHLHSHL